MVEMSSPEEHATDPAADAKQNCIFCHIIAGRVPSKEVYSDDKVKAILDINPANPGHVLILPKEHYMILPQVPDELIGYLGMVGKAISKACLRALKAQGTNVFVANGAAAGQKAGHVMVHVIPRKTNDGQQAFALPHRQLPDAQYEKIAAALAERVAKALGAAAQKPATNRSTPQVSPTVSAPTPQATPIVSAPSQPVSPQPAPSPIKSAVDLDSIANLLGGGSAPEAEEETSEEAAEPSRESERFVASKHGGKFHIRACPFIAKINTDQSFWIKFF